MKEKKRRFENDVTEYEYLFQEKEVRGKKKSRFLGRVLRKNFWSLFWSSVVYIIKASPVWATPIVTTNIINTLTFYLKGSMELSDAIRSVVVNAVVLTVLIVQNIPMHMLWAKICSRMFRENSANTRSAVVKKLQRLSITYHKEMETGKIQSKFLRDVESMDALISNIQNNLLPSIFGVLISIGISLYNSRIMTVFFLVVIPVNVALAMLFNKKMRKNFRTLRKDSEEVAGKLSTIMEMLVVTKAHGLEEKEYNDFQKQIDRLKKSGRSADMTNAYFGSVAWVLSNLLSGVCLAFCAYLAFRGEIDVGDIVLYQSLFSSINNNVLLLINIMPQLVQGVDSVHSISEIMNTNDIEETHIGVNPPEITGRVDFNCVSYRYPDSDQHVVKNFDLHVAPGECIAVVGSSGSGKSTLMNMIIGFLKPASGTIAVDGKSLSEVDLSEYRHFISVVPPCGKTLRTVWTAIPRRTCSASSRWRTWRSSSKIFPRDWIRRSANTAAGFRAGRNSASRLRARSSATPRSSFWTRRPARWTIFPNTTCRRRFPRSSRGAPRSSWRTGSPPSGTPTASSSWKTARRWRSVHTRS